MCADSAVINGNVQQRQKEEGNNEHDIAIEDPAVNGDLVHDSHVDSGGEESDDQVGDGDSHRDVWKLLSVEV